ncbi:MAG: ABC transporter ATP-binding protein [bacterium]|nr:ABC transporter ATP-binding protein [bacterium]
MSIIKVENLSKKYIIGHNRNAGDAYRYSSLRDTLAHSARGMYQRLRHPLAPNRENTDLEEFWALKDINFEIKQGDKVGIIGRNGAGKSTLLKILSRITEPTTGKITLNGRVASLLEVGTGFHPELSGRENIYLNGAVLGMSRIEIKKKFDEIVDFSGVEKFLDTPVKRYSSGMYVRLAFSVAAHLEPEILLVDEVLAVGDAEFQKKCLGKMEDVSKEGRTIIFVSHNMNAIMSLCTRSLLLNNGNIILNSQPSNTIEYYQNSEITQEFDFYSKKNRRGNGICRIRSVNIINQNNQILDYIELGSKISIRLTYALNKCRELTNIRIIIGIYNMMGEGVARFDSNATTKKEIICSKSKGSIICKIEDKINLIPGNYCFNIAIFNMGDLSDHLVSCKKINIINNNYFGTGKELDTYKLAKVLYKHSWGVIN